MSFFFIHHNYEVLVGLLRSAHGGRIEVAVLLYLSRVREYDVTMLMRWGLVVDIAEAMVLELLVYCCWRVWYTEHWCSDGVEVWGWCNSFGGW